ncbi:DUF6250 domain-containing protein [Gramella sp. AN32]|uniref:DUF6250 domain-containing protein n=1 Tax=Christiangramia antarctica TaxID=2058158 RepID=A0ABW5X1L0_9FLAO|nr:DUF6250 domain-containing protein [Gramella sp. AN32]MCM4157051.1 hypothetical protein [Gramella sp. AN32]
MKRRGQLLFLFIVIFLIMDFTGSAQVISGSDYMAPEHLVIEQQPGGSVTFDDGAMEITDVNGCTVWFKNKLESPVKIEYEVTFIDEGGPFDRVSDLNCFWMATDPKNPDDFFAASEERAGKFTNYHGLELYYVGYGGHNNTKTRFRRYNGTMDRPLLPEHDLSEKKFMIKANIKIHVCLIADGNQISYVRNGETVFSIDDEEPYTEGYFGIRTVNNHMKIENLKISNLN